MNAAASPNGSKTWNQIDKLEQKLEKFSEVLTSTREEVVAIHTRQASHGKMLWFIVITVVGAALAHIIAIAK